MAEQKRKDLTLVIVESPAKAKTINKYLGKNYKVTASMGHIIDLPKSRIGVDVKNNFTPEYITVRGKGKILNELKKLASQSKFVLLASDNDREGEAIAYHISESLKEKYPQVPIKRIVFNEITKPAILEAIKSPRDIEFPKVNAQKTRRILDRLVGYNISPILWAKVKNGLSAGRVQSVTLRVICEREDEIEKFIPEEYWTLEAIFAKSKKEFTAELFKVDNKKPEFRNQDDVNKLLKSLDEKNFSVTAIQTSSKSIRPTPPFTTSKLQQVAANRFGFTSKKTMSIAQQLYEGIDIGRETVGFITYMRTDSTRISPQAIGEVRNFIEENFKESLPESPNYYSKSETAQDAHEAIRPTSVHRTPDLVKKYLTPDQFKIYSIIWEKFVSSQMTPSEYSTETILIDNNNATFKISKSTLLKEGYNAVLNLLKSKDGEEKYVKIPPLKEGDKLDLKKYLPEQHFTQPPPRYTDATIVKFLEENGIGRPSTYAPTISTLQERYYVERKQRQLVPTVLGKLVNQLIVKSFPDIVDIGFTAKMEDNLDNIEKSNLDGTNILKNFYVPFIEEIEEASKNLSDHKKSFDEQTGELCEKCGKPMVKKLGKFGFFIACSGFPSCKNSKPIPLADCPKDGCNGKIIERKKAKRGKKFYGCTNYPTCDFVSWFKPTEFSCPKCGKFLIEKNDKIHGSYKTCIDEKCGYKQVEEH
ncbi:MAG: DNA topoisomerase I [Spirochaetes bacterium GWD1_27_9]|nr:MAG: DNA topoisomerase I [Spirochaetes bacterium GWB1_27_13]OHD41683.1 MAG: DNA topoisomerase I [Spirochaetes bacterium GWD1_27_9]